MPNKQLTAKVRIDASQAHKTIDKLITKINKINAVVNKPAGTSGLEKKIEKALLQQEKLKQATLKTQTAEAKLTAQKSKSVEATNKAQIAEQRLASQTERTRVGIERINQVKQQSISKATTIVDKVRQWAKNQSNVTSATRSTNNALSGVWTKLKGIAATYLGIMGGRALIKTSDIITSAQNRLNNLNGGDKQLTQQQMDKMYVSANNARMAYTDMLSNASKSMTLAGDAFQGNMDNAVRFQEIMAKSYALGGASAEEMSSSMYQMIQALGSGTLAGDELRSVREGAPLAYKAIEKYVQGVMAQSEATKDFAKMSLKDIAAEGLVTSDMVVAAVMDAGGKIDKQFEETAMTFGQAWDRIKSSAVKAFEPVSNRLNEMLNRAAENGMFEKIETAFENISKALQIIFEVIYQGISWIADNWNWLQHLVVAGLIILATMWIWQAGVAIASFVAQLLAMSSIQWAILIIIASILGVIYIWYLWKTGAIDTCETIIYCLLLIGAVALILGLIFNSTGMIILGVIMLVLGIIIWALEYILGVIYAAISMIWNNLLMLVSLIIKNAIAPLLVAWDNFANFFGNVFNDPISAIIQCFKKLADTVLSLLQTIAQGIDAIFGSNLTSVVQGWRNGLSSKADALAKKYGNGTYQEKSNVTDKVLGAIDSAQTNFSWSTSSAWNLGKEHGAAAKGWIAGLGANSQTGFGNFSLDSIGNQFGLNFGSGFPSASDPANGVANSYQKPNPNDLLSGIADDTGSIADSMDLTEDDLKYLRDVANMEWKKEFTTATIVVDMKNNNTINGDGDLDGIVTRLADRLYEEMDYLANGVYA